jgi:putative Mg2+ transporter-C (MgtC) family protein
MYLEVIIRLVVAAILGSLIGLERERLDRGAGLRTHALVATASALVIIVSAYGFSDVIQAGRIVLDPSRVAAQVVSGIGFLGAGTIILRKNAIRGLTTAASVWAVAGIGLAAGAGLYVAAAATTAILLAILLALKPVEGRIFPHKRVWRITLRAQTRPGQVIAIEERVNALHLELRRLELLPDEENGMTTFRLDVHGGAPPALATLAEELQHIAGARSVSYRGQHAVPDERAGGSQVNP